PASTWSIASSMLAVISSALRAGKRIPSQRARLRTQTECYRSYAAIGPMTELFLFPIPVFNASRYKHDSIYALLTEDGSVANYIDSDDGEEVAAIAQRHFPSHEVRLYPRRDATAPDLPQWAKHSRVIGALEEGLYRGLSSVFPDERVCKET